jgi:hypothetical protein
MMISAAIPFHTTHGAPLKTFKLTPSFKMSLSQEMSLLPCLLRLSCDLEILWQAPAHDDKLASLLVDIPSHRDFCYLQTGLVM